MNFTDLIATYRRQANDFLPSGWSSDVSNADNTPLSNAEIAAEINLAYQEIVTYKNWRWRERVISAPLQIKTFQWSSGFTIPFLEITQESNPNDFATFNPVYVKDVYTANALAHFQKKVGNKQNVVDYRIRQMWVWVPEANKSEGKKIYLGTLYQLGTPFLITYYQTFPPLVSGTDEPQFQEDLHALIVYWALSKNDLISKLSNAESKVNEWKEHTKRLMGSLLSIDNRQ